VVYGSHRVYSKHSSTECVAEECLNQCFDAASYRNLRVELRREDAILLSPVCSYLAFFSASSSSGEGLLLAFPGVVIGGSSGVGVDHS